MQFLARRVAVTVMLFVTAAGVASAAELHIAAVNMAKLMKGYDKAQRAESGLREQAEDFKLEQDAMRGTLKELNAAYQEAAAEAEDAALSAAAREKKKDLAIEKLTALKTNELKFRRRTREVEKEINAQGRRMRESLMEDLRVKVREHAAKQGYDLVIDTITVVYLAPGKVADITDVVAATLNGAE